MKHLKTRSSFRLKVGAASKYISCTRGSTALMFSLALPAVLAAVGVGADFAVYNMKLTTLQSAADQSAIAAVKELSVVNASADTVAQVADNFARSAVLGAGSSLAVNADVGTAKDSVKVTLTESWTPFFAEFIGADVTPIIARATAKLAGTANICVLALNPADPNTFHMDKEAKVVATGCAVYSNSNDPDGIKIDSNANINAALICSAGGVKAMTNAIRPSATTDCEVIPDPLASRVVPDPSKCDFNTTALSKGSHTLSPGTYCKGLKISGTAKVTFKTGDYVVTGGRFEISGDASVVGENVAFYLHGENTTIQFTQNTSLSLSGASTGPMAGLLFFEDRKVTTGRQHRINSVNAHRLTGTIYLSRGHLRIDPNSTVAQDSAYTAIIARTIEVDEGPTLVLNDDYDASNVPVPEGIKMSTQVVLVD